MNKNLGVLIIFFNKLSQTIECIESFLPAGMNIYVLNNASSAASWEALQTQYSNHKNVLFFHSPQNLGPARGRNLLLEKSSEEWLFLVDNDICIRPAESWKQLFDQKLETVRGADIFCPRLFNLHENSYARPYQLVLRNNRVQIEETEEAISNYFPCGAVIINRRVFEKYGYFDPELFAFEEYEFSIRAMCSQAGALKVYPLPEIELVHDHRFQQNKSDKKAVLERYNELKIESSLQRIMDKHRVIFDHNWQWWTRKQVADMNGKSFFGKVKQRVAGIIHRH